MKAFHRNLALAVLFLSATGIHGADASDLRTQSGDDAPCVKEQWSATRTLVWAKPGEDGPGLDSRGWTEFASAEDYAVGKGGKPAETGPDADTDLILPDAPAGESYIVGCMVSAKERQRPEPGAPLPFLTCRHLTVGRGAALDGGMGVSRGRLAGADWPVSDTPILIHGNVTVEDDGYLYGHLMFVGDKHTCFAMGESPEPLGRSLLVRKAVDASVTFTVPRYDLVDAVSVESGRLVLARGTHLRINAGYQPRIDRKKLNKRGFGRVEPYTRVCEGAVLEMRPGSRLGRVNPPQDIAADVRVEGLLDIGRAADDSDAPAVIELTASEGDGTFLNQAGGLYFGPTATFRNLGRLSITAGKNDSPADDESDEPASGQGISVFLETSVDFGNVSIDHLRAGGIAATDPAAAKKGLSAARFGDNCEATGDAIYSTIETVNFQGGLGTVEFVDGLSTLCEVLFPLGDRLIVRSTGNRTAQSFDLATVHSVEIDGRRTEYYPRRALTNEESRTRQTNALWADMPGVGQIGKYGEQRWPRVPLMVWRYPGRSGSRFVGPNWLDENGRPCFEPPIGTDVIGPDAPVADILLPASDTFYQVVGDRPQWRCRHMTIEDNAFFFLTYNIWGNLWMKDGSGMQAPWFGMYSNTTPGLHRFLRFDGMRIRRPDRGRTVPRRLDPADCTISQWGRYQTGPDGTLEIIGTHMVNDHFFVGGEGKLIMSERSNLAPLAARAAFWIQPGGTAVLLQDARIGVESTAMDHACIPVLVSGTLQIGTPERPITRDMLFPLAGMEEDEINRRPGENMRGSGVSLLIGKQGRLVMHSADPTKARVVFKMHDSEKAKARGERWGAPKGIVLDFAGEAELDGVVFDNVLKDGLMATPEQRAAWKSVFYGKNNLGEPDTLYWDGDE